jgi:hypothetical protein
LRTKIKYFIAKAAIFLLAIRILDVSIDVDFAVELSCFSATPNYDAIDSFSEFVLENIFDNDKLIADSNPGDHHHNNQRPANNFSIFYVAEIKSENSNILKDQAPIIITAIPNNTKFNFEDYSRSPYNPPDLSATTI